jgi:hypothetical protein
MDFEFCFKEQLKMHPSMQPWDAIKLCYQAAFGAEHILSDIESAYVYLSRELESVFPTNEPLYEQISPFVVRVNLGAWKRENKSLDMLFEAFKNSAYIQDDAKEIFFSYLEVAEKVMCENIADFSKKEWELFLSEYKNSGMPPIHHSEGYRKIEKPSYRIVKLSELEKIL